MARGASIDNDDSRDLDQLTVAETLPGDAVKILVAVADVDALVKDGSALDAHARHNTTSVYSAFCGASRVGHGLPLVTHRPATARGLFPTDEKISSSVGSETADIQRSSRERSGTRLASCVERFDK